MEVVKFKTDEERREAVRRMIGLRKVFEARIREINATNHPMHNQVISSFHNFIQENDQE